MLIGMCGPAGSGKDTVANMIVNKMADEEINLYALASPIKKAVNSVFGWDDRHAYGELKEVVDPIFGVSPRKAYQTFGTEWGREIINEDIWLILANQFIEKHEHVIVTDVRFPNEVDLIRKNGGVLVYIDRPGVEQVGVSNHASESGIQHLLMDDDFIVHNTGTMDELDFNVGMMVDYILNGDAPSKMDLSDAWSSVKEFNYAIRGREFYNTTGGVSASDIKNALGLIEEEFTETQEALMLVDKKEVADGLCDLIVVVYGMLMVARKDQASLMPMINYEVDISNLKTTTDEITRVIRRIKGMLSVEQSANPEYVVEVENSAVGSVIEELGYYSMALFVIYDKLVPSLNLQRNLAEVCRSNMDKFCSMKIAEETADSINALRPNSAGVSRSGLGDLYCVRRLSDGKLLKPHTWTKPNIIVG